MCVLGTLCRAPQKPTPHMENAPVKTPFPLPISHFITIPRQHCGEELKAATIKPLLIFTCTSCVLLQHN